MPAALSLAAARFLYAIALSERALQITIGERRAAEIERNQVEHASSATIAWARRLERAVKKAMEEEQEGWIEALYALGKGLDSPDDAAALRALGDLRGWLGGDPAFQDVAGFVRACEDRDPLVLGRRRLVPAETPRSDQASAVLGQACDAPISPSGTTLLRALVSDRSERWSRDHAGLHLAVDRRGMPHSHHGIYLGDGSVVHFAGEPGKRQAAARVERISAEAFMGADGAARTHCIEVAEFADRPVATLDPAIVCLRALARFGADGYELLFSNCEHLSTWAQIGVSVSTQVEKWQRRLQYPRAQAQGHVAALLERKLTFSREPLSQGVLVDGRDDAYPIDLARAYWARDRGEPVVWFPLWAGQDAPVAGVHRPWTAGALGSRSEWHASCPALNLDPAWHASLISFGATRAYWLTSDGRWFQYEGHLADVIEPRLEEARAVVSNLVTAPSRFAQGAVNVAERIVRRADEGPEDSGHRRGPATGGVTD